MSFLSSTLKLDGRNSWLTTLGKHLSGWRHLYEGIAQIAITPPPALKRAPWGTFFQARFYLFTIFTIFLTIFLPFSLNKCPKPSGQGFRPPQNQANAHLNLENSSLKKCPKPSGQGLRPPPQTGNAHMGVETSRKGLPVYVAYIAGCRAMCQNLHAWYEFCTL